MVSVLTVVTPHVLTVFRGKYIDFQSKMLCGKRVSVLGRGGRDKVSWETCCGNQVSVSASLAGAVPHGKRGAYHGKRRAY